MYNENHNASPINPLPPAVILISLALALPELAFQAGAQGWVGGPGAVGWRLEAITSYGFFDTVFNWMLQTGRMPPEHMLRFVSYTFVNFGFYQAAFAIVLILTVGKMVAETFSQLTFLTIFFASTIIGALAYALFLTTNVPLVGAYPAAYGLIGAMSFILWIKAKIEGSNPYRAFSLIGFLIGIQIFGRLVFGGGNEWVADIAGFLTGFVLSVIMAPGGAERMLAILVQMRRR